MTIIDRESARAFPHRMRRLQGETLSDSLVNLIQAVLHEYTAPKMAGLIDCLQENGYIPEYYLALNYNRYMDYIDGIANGYTEQS